MSSRLNGICGVTLACTTLAAITLSMFCAVPTAVAADRMVVAEDFSATW